MTVTRSDVLQAGVIEAFHDRGWGGRTVDGEWERREMPRDREVADAVLEVAARHIEILDRPLWISDGWWVKRDDVLALLRGRDHE